MTRASGALASASPQGLVVRVETMPPDVDPLALWHAVSADRRFYWEQPLRDTAIAGVGTAAVFTASGSSRFPRIAAGLAEVLHEHRDAVAVGGFAFAPDGGGGTVWRGFPAAEWLVPRLTVVRRGGRARLIAVAEADESPAVLDDLVARGRAALDTPVAAAGPAATYRATGGTPAHWRRAVEATLEDIAARRLDKLVLARAASIRASVPFDAVHVAGRLRRGFPECTVFAVAQGAATFVGASPERLVRVAGRRLDTAAVAGTAARGASARTDRRLARALLADPKERAEHALVVEDLRARLRPLCEELSGPVTPRILATQAVQHLHTPIRARLRPGMGLFDAVAGLHPTPAVCGVPRDVAQRALPAREAITRGWYGGGVGWAGADGGEVTVALRTALLRGPHALLHAGAGIVAGSTWDAELEETRLKLRPMLTALLEL
jgi:isochorismate synthase